MRPEDQGAGRERSGAPPRYTVVPRTLLFITRPGAEGRREVLLLRGAPDKRLWAGQYNGIGGHLEAGESPEASARRELLEETGLEVDSLALRAIIHITLPDPPGIVLFVFVGTGPRGQESASDEGTPVWIPLDRLEDYPLVEDLPELLPRLLAADAEQGPGMIYGIYHVTDAGLRMTFSRTS